MTAVYDNRACTLGEGPLWHPQCEQLFWFDIIQKKLLTVGPDGPQEWVFQEHVSAAGWISKTELLIASESALFRFNLTTGIRQDLCPLEADNPITRSNDGRADPYGGFWIGTMGKNAELGAGAIYRYYRGIIRCLFKNLTIPNAICFTPDGKHGHFADTSTGLVKRVSLDANGWPKAPPEVFLDLRAEGLHPDGAVIDAAGTMWLAQWGAGRVAAYGRDGSFRRAVAFDAPHSTCPAFGGAGNTTLYCTTALQGMTDAQCVTYPDAGKTFALPDVSRGQYEHQVIL